MWVLWAFGSALCAGLSSVLAKCGVKHTDPTLATALRTVVVLAMAWAVVFLAGAQADIAGISPAGWAFLVLSGLATGASWLCYFKALQLGPASAVAPIDKLSILVTVAFSRLVLGERLGRRAALGLGLLCAGTLGMLAA